MAGSEAREKIIARLRRIGGPSLDHVAIADHTEIYYDLGIFGWDLWDFFVWLRDEFGVTIEIEPSRFGPREGVPPLFFRRWRQERERKKQPYKSLTVSDILKFIEPEHPGD